ncbi:piggyBac transposable element-derived protein 4-like [Montipora foliosa]|uniref:piggyBac transposable element-derived protein 4-like n=1 Tax=Montipora foliosa TaxID=591990 RepID=UPI0035F21A65
MKRLFDEVFGREDSDGDQSTSDAVSEEGESDVSEEESDIENENEEENWVVGSIEPTALDFTADRSLNADLPDSPSFIDYFYLLFPEHLLTRQTNKYARETIASLRERGRLPLNSRFKTWPEDGVTAGDIKAFLAVIIAMGLVNEENIQDYWSTDEGHAGYNPLNKLGAVYNVVTDNFSNVWTPGREICIDEGMIPLRGKVHFKVYNPDKPDKYGVKSYQLCDSCNGYCCKFEIYTGGNQDPPSAKGKTYDLVMRLMQPYLNARHCLYHTVQDYVAAYVRRHDTNNNDDTDH